MARELLRHALVHSLGAALPFQLVVGLLIYRKVSRTLHGQDTGRFSAEEISLFRQRVWGNVNALSLIREGRRQVLALVTRCFGSWEGMSRLKRIRFCLALSLRRLFALRMLSLDNYVLLVCADPSF